MENPDCFENLVGALNRLPGIGMRTAERMAYRLLAQPDLLLRDLRVALDAAARQLRSCERCGAVTTPDRNPCRLCQAPDRDANVICVVESPEDIRTLERSGGFHGRYHALMGKLSALQGDGPGDLRLAQLEHRLEAEAVTEVVLALNTDVESDATAALIIERLRRFQGIRVTRLAFGLPVGSGIAYSDPVTLGRALAGRQGVGGPGTDSGGMPQDPRRPDRHRGVVGKHQV